MVAVFTNATAATQDSSKDR